MSGLLISIVSLPFSIALCHFGIIIILLNWAIERDWQNKWLLAKNNSSVFLFIAFFLFHLVGIFYSNDFENSLFNVEKKFSLFIVPVVLATSAISTKNKTILCKAFIASCLLASLICLGAATYRIVQEIDSSHLNFGFVQPDLLLSNPFFANQWQEFSYVTLSSGIGIHPTYFSVYIILCLAFLIVCHKTLFVRQSVSFFLILFFTLFLALLSSRITIAVILALVAIVIIYSIFKLSRGGIKYLAVGTGLIVLFISLSALNPVSLYREFQELRTTPIQIDNNTTYFNSTDVRLSLWWLGFKTATKSNLFFGLGTSSAEGAMAETANNYQITNVLNSNDPHNQYLNTYISLGLIGLLLLLGCYLFPLRTAWLTKDLIQLIFIGLILIVSFTESFLELQKGITFFALFQSLFAFNSPEKAGSTKLSPQ